MVEVLMAESNVKGNRLAERVVMQSVAEVSTV